jgi:hypothetical protein
MLISPNRTATQSFNMKLFTHQLLLLLLLLLAMLVQFQVIWQLESSLMDYSPVAVVSLMFLPHGIRSIAIVLSGAKALIPIFLTHLITDLLLGLGMVAGLMSGAVTVVAMVLPLVMLNFLSQKQAFEPLAQGNTENLSLFRLVIVVGAISSMANGAFGAIRFSTSPMDMVALKYFVGDMLGVAVTLMILLVAKRQLIALGKRLI